jgi:hypothetical protein
MVVGGGGANSMLQFQLEKGGDNTKHCWKIKQRRRTHLRLHVNEA